MIHEQYETDDGELVLFECTECGYVSMSLGTLHAHIETHRGYTRFGIQLPFTTTSVARADELMDRSEVLRVTSTDTIELGDVPGF